MVCSARSVRCDWRGRRPGGQQIRWLELPLKRLHDQRSISCRRVARAWLRYFCDVRDIVRDIGCVTCPRPSSHVLHVGRQAVPEARAPLGLRNGPLAGRGDVSRGFPPGLDCSPSAPWECSLALREVAALYTLLGVCRVSLNVAVGCKSTEGNDTTAPDKFFGLQLDNYG